MRKGYISSVDEANKRAIVIPFGAEESVTPPLVIPWHLRNTLQPNVEVAYSVFDDGTGIILERMDGLAGNIEVADMKTANVSSYNSHVHDYVNESGTAQTGAPETPEENE